MIRAIAILAMAASCGRVAFDPLVDASTSNADAAMGGPGSFATGRLHNCALNSGGAVVCWGANDLAQLGNGTAPTDQSVPQDNVAVGIGLSAGEHHTCAISADGSLDCWGQNDVGQLANGTVLPQPLPGRVSGNSDFVELALGNFHTCVRTKDGNVLCAGEMLGSGTPAGTSSLTLVPGITDAVQLTAGSQITCARRTSGAVACWGTNGFGALGRPGPDSTTPVDVQNLTDATQVAAGNNHVCALRATGKVVCWGRNRDGNLGDGMQTDRDTPVEVVGISGAVEIAAGDFFSCARRGPQDIQCWGANTNLQLGNPSAGPIRSLVPVPVIGLPNVVRFECGGTHVCALAETGELWCWGGNVRAQLGSGSGLPTSRVTPMPVMDFP